MKFFWINYMNGILFLFQIYIYKINYSISVALFIYFFIIISIQYISVLVIFIHIFNYIMKWNCVQLTHTHRKHWMELYRLCTFLFYFYFSVKSIGLFIWCYSTLASFLAIDPPHISLFVLLEIKIIIKYFTKYANLIKLAYFQIPFINRFHHIYFSPDTNCACIYLFTFC
jgi:hypothetical protein